ncbi:MAG TPA: tRNA lysidine(34) synthetase TilS [Clostridia bacterium]|nr:tRNA lysidine(34) synthetase TilS [Clostridia bacterium]
MICKVKSTISSYNMLNNCSTVIVAVSGGADSMALLSILNCLKTKYNIEIIAAHVNHSLRGRESDRDELFVRDYCKDNSIELRVLKKDIKKISEEKGLGIEECARHVRYDFFNSICSSALIATAHTLNDRVETMLFNLARGSVLKGLCSIPPVRENIIRPIIDCTKQEVLDYCKEKDIYFVTDSSNDDIIYSRNRIRHRVIPELEKINSGLEISVSRCLNSINEDEDYLNSRALKLVDCSKLEIGYNAVALYNAHPSVRKRALVLIIKNKTFKAPLNHHVEAVDNLLIQGGKMQIISGLTIEVKDGELTFPTEKKPSEKWCIGINKAKGAAEYPYGTAEIEIVNRNYLECTQKINKDVLDNCFDYDKITDKLFLRSRVEGDRVLLKGRGCTKTLKKLFNESCIPVEERNKLAVMSDDNGILWIEGFGCSDRCRITENTENIMIVKIRRCSFEQ